MIHIDLLKGQYFESKSRELEDDNIKLKVDKAEVEDKLMRQTRMLLHYDERRIGDESDDQVTFSN